MNAQSFLSVRYLGSGGFSTVDEVVHRGTNLRLGRKTLKNRGPAAIQYLWEEVSVLQKLRHPHVIRFLGAYSQGDKMSILLSPIADTTLSLWLDRFSSEKPANFSQVITKMFGCLASSVRYLHEQRPVVKHLDIKPQNVLIVEGDGEFPHVVLCDFGISTADDVSAQLSRPLTRQYVAPEVFKATSRKAAADIWSLGCVFAEMASLSFGDTNSKWLSLRKEFSGRSGKYYWQDIAGLQDRLTTVLENATTITETTVVRTLKAMLRSQPSERPDAAALTMVFTPAPCCLSWPNDNATYPGPREELSSVEMLVHEDGVDCNAQLHQHTEITTATSQGLEHAKKWLEQCSHSHEVCSHSTPDDVRTLPSRLLDVQSIGRESQIRIVDTAGIEPQLGSVDYVALSHTWTESQMTLTAENLQALSTSIPLSALSGTLRDAITSAQRLGFRYLWTDSLCVIQDSEDDKRAECANMASVFRNAALTLVLDSIDAGLSDFRASLSSSQSAFSWDTRAWSLQERLLSRRFLHLGQEQMYWECNSLKASETFPQGLPLLVWEKAHSKPDTALEKPIANVKATATVAVATNDKTSSLQPHRLRNCQWIRKEGDGIGDSMEVGTTSLKVNDAQASSPSIVNDKLGNFPVFTTSTCGDGNTRPSGKDPAVLQPSYKSSMQGSFSDPGDASPPLSSVENQAKSNETRSNEARQDVRMSGQLDQNGNGNRDVSGVNANGNVSGVIANGNVREDGVAETNTGRKEGVSYLV
jgi:serine/threonine protein kinase